MSTQDPLIGQVLGGARLEQRVSKGLLADVYRGQYERLNVPVAVKVLSPKAMAQGVNKERFLREGRALAQLQHNNIIKIYNVGHEQSRYFIIMDWIQDGVNLRQLAQTHPLTPAQSLKVIQRLCDAMEYIHQKSLIHRDLKPANICLRRGGHPVLMDFSLIKDQSSDVQLTAPGTIMGTVNFMPPEQAQPGGAFGDVSVRSDVYSLGGTLYWLLTGKPPFKGRTPMETIIKLMREEPAAPSTHNPSLPKVVDQLVLETLSKKQEQRPATPRDLSNRIEEVFRNYRNELEAAQRPALAADDSGKHKSASQEGSGPKANTASGAGRAPQPTSSATWGAVQGGGQPAQPAQAMPAQPLPAAGHPQPVAPAARGPAHHPQAQPAHAAAMAAGHPAYPQQPYPQQPHPGAAAMAVPSSGRGPGLGVAEPPAGAGHRASSQLRAAPGAQPQAPPQPAPEGDESSEVDPHEVNEPFAPSLSTEGAAAGLLKLPAELAAPEPDQDDSPSPEVAPKPSAPRSRPAASGGGGVSNTLVIAGLLLVTAASLTVFVLIFFLGWDPFK